MKNKIRCTGTYRNSLCNRFLGETDDMKGFFATKCERCNGQVEIVDGQIVRVTYLKTITSKNSEKIVQ